MTEIKTCLTQAEQQALQAKLFALLARQVRNYTKGESDSVPWRRPRHSWTRSVLLWGWT